MFQYYVQSLGAGIERSSVRLVADAGEVASNNSSIQFTLPTESIVDLNSVQFNATLRLKNAVDASASVVMPQTHTLFRSCQWSLNGNIVAGMNNQSFGQAYELLRRATTGLDDALSRVSEYADVPQADSDGKFQASFGLTNTGQRVQFNDFMGLQRSPNAGAWDTAIFGTTRLHLYLESDRIMMDALQTGITQNCEWELANLELRVDVLKVPAMIDDIITARLMETDADGMPIGLDTVYPEIYTQVSSSDQNIRCSIASNSLDMLGWAPLASEYLSKTDVTAGAGNVIAAANSPYGANFVRFKLQNTSNSVPAINSTTEQYNFVLAGKTIPASGRTPVVQGVEYTKDCFSRNVGEFNQLYGGNIDDDGSSLQRTRTFKRENLFNYNTFVCHKLCLTAPAHETAERTLSGYNSQGASSIIQLQTQGLSTSDYILIMGQTSAVLSASAGQQVSVAY